MPVGVIGELRRRERKEPMGLSSMRPRPRRGRLSEAVALLTVAIATLAACGSSSKPASTAAAVAAMSRVCTTVTDVLGNGPDPDVDPVGYAEAQPIQLRRVRTADAKLHAAIDSLANAYQQFARTNGGRAAKAAVKTASARLDAICPGATS
jgi:hypothetical protein